jgi:hypothetical protein
MLLSLGSSPAGVDFYEATPLVWQFGNPVRSRDRSIVSPVRRSSKNREAAFLRVPFFAHLSLDRGAGSGRRRLLHLFAALRIEHAVDQVIDGRLSRRCRL